MNTVLANAAAEGRIPGSVWDVLYLENEAGYIIENLNPTSDDMYFAWDQNKNQMIYLMSDLETVYYPEDYTLVPGNCWITVGTADEATKISNKGYNFALERDIKETIYLSNVVSIDTLGFTASDVQFNGVSESVTTTARMIGSFGNVGGSIGGASVTWEGSASTIALSGASTSSLVISGAVNSFQANVGNSTISQNGSVNTLSGSATVTNNGIIRTANAGTSVNNSGIVENSSGANVQGANVSVKFVADSKEDLENLRYQVISAGETFVGRTVELAGNINLNNISFCPISSYYRKDAADKGGKMTDAYASECFFQGTFDGKHYTISNLSNNGFSISGMTQTTNATPATFNGVPYNESIYGLFASVSDATFRDFTITCDIHMVKSDKDLMVGDSVGALIGFSYGNLTLENITVNGTVEGYDGVGGVVGRAYGKNSGSSTITLTNVTNNADVTGVRKTGGIIGYVSGPTVVMDNVHNNGNVECLGWKYDQEVLKCDPDGSKNAASHYVASYAYSHGSVNKTTVLDGFTQKAEAKLIIAGKECSYYVLHEDSTWVDRQDY